MKKFIICSTCEVSGQENAKDVMLRSRMGDKYLSLKMRGGIELLGEIRDDGTILVKRGNDRYTVIQGSEFTILCSRCCQPVFRREVNGTLQISEYRFAWAVGGSLSQSVGTSEQQSI